MRSGGVVASALVTGFAVACSVAYADEKQRGDAPGASKLPVRSDRSLKLVVTVHEQNCGNRFLCPSFAGCVDIKNVVGSGFRRGESEGGLHRCARESCSVRTFSHAGSSLAI